MLQEQPWQSSATSAYSTRDFSHPPILSIRLGFLSYRVPRHLNKTPAGSGCQGITITAHIMCGGLRVTYRDSPYPLRDCQLFLQGHFPDIPVPLLCGLCKDVDRYYRSKYDLASLCHWTRHACDK